jgi:hypothetical protein
MKLYAELMSEKNSKMIGKGGDKYIEIRLAIGQDHIGTVILDSQGGKDWDLSYERNGESSYLIDNRRGLKNN